MALSVEDHTACKEEAAIWTSSAHNPGIVNSCSLGDVVWDAQGPGVHLTLTLSN